MAIIDHANFETGGQKIFAWEYPQKNLSSNTLLNVRQGQEALFLLGGQIKAKYGPNGSQPHVLDTSNLPVVRKLFGIPFGGSNPLLASVWFINKADILDLTIQTDTFLIKDPSKAQGFPVIAEATLGLQIVEAEPFFLQLVNGNPRFGAYDMTSSIRGRITREVSQKIAYAVETMQLSFAELSAQLSTLSRNVENTCTDFIARWGLAFVDFNVRVTQDTSRNGMLMASGFGTDVDTFERQRLLDIQEKAMENMKDGKGGAASLLVAMTMANNMNPRTAPPTSYQQNAAKEEASKKEQQRFRVIFCANCGNKYTSETSFCSDCGKKYTPCPQCCSDTDPNGKRCSNCGVELQNSGQQPCTNCRTNIPLGVAYCPNCGRPVSEGKCLNCGHGLHDEKFCPKCGTPNNR